MVRLSNAMINVEGFYELLENPEVESLEIRIVRTDEQTIMFEIKQKDKKEYYLKETDTCMDIIATAIKVTMSAVPK
jgi:hypothetical protein